MDQNTSDRGRPATRLTWGRWYLWFVIAAVLFAIGSGALVVLGDGKTATGEDDTGVLNGLAWLAWILSWIGAIVSAGLGVFNGARRGLRHRAILN